MTDPLLPGEVGVASLLCLVSLPLLDVGLRHVGKVDVVDLESKRQVSPQEARLMLLLILDPRDQLASDRQALRVRKHLRPTGRHVLRRQGSVPLACDCQEDLLPRIHQLRCHAVLLASKERLIIIQMKMDRTRAEQKTDV